MAPRAINLVMASRSISDCVPARCETRLSPPSSAAAMSTSRCPRRERGGRTLANGAPSCPSDEAPAIMDPSQVSYWIGRPTSGGSPEVYGILLSFGCVLTAYPADDGPAVTPSRPAVGDEKPQSLAAR